MRQDVDLIEHGFTRALWLFGEPKWYLRPDGLSICTEEEAIAEIRQALGEVDEDE
jgi:hypothetical protein